MNIPIKDTRFYDVEAMCPKELNDFLYQINTYRRKCNFYSDQPTYSEALEIMNLLDTILWEFSSIIKEYSDKNKKGSEVSNALEEDITNYLNFMNIALEKFPELPKERRSIDSLKYIFQKIETIFNSHLGACLLEAWEKSRKERPSIKYSSSGELRQRGTENYCDEKIFYEELFNSVKRHAGIFKRQLFIMSRGNIQSTYLPYFQGNQKPIPAEKLGKLNVTGQLDEEIVEIKDIDGEDEVNS